MNYIVFDLEWNQNPDGRRHPDSRLPFEIIEIGAVKLNEKREIVDTFQCLIKPKVYHWIHDSIHEVIHVDYHELENGIPFPRAIRRFSGMVRRGVPFFYLGKSGCYGTSDGI
ncbi:MAG: exonuclease domain-containing protein [Ruminococcus sp.]